MTHNLEVNFDTTTPFVKEDTAKELQNHAGKTQDTWVGAVENVEVAEIECVETMMSAELTEESELLNFEAQDPIQEPSNLQEQTNYRV